MTETAVHVLISGRVQGVGYRAWAADTARRMGSLLAAADARNLSFAALSASSRVVGEVKALDSLGLAQLMLLHRTQE